MERAAHSAQPGGETLNAMWSVLALIGVLIAVNGFLSGSEAALISLHESRLHRLQRSGPPRRPAGASGARPYPVPRDRSARHYPLRLPGLGSGDDRVC